MSASETAEALRKAMKGFGTDEGALVDIVGCQTAEQLMAAKEAYTNEIGRDLIKDIKSECGGNFEDVLVALLTDPAEYDAQLIKGAIKGMGTDEDVLSEVLCTRTEPEIKAAAEAYERLYGEPMITQVEDDTDGDLQKTYNLLITGDRDEKKDADVGEDVQALFNAGEGKWGTNEGVFIRTLGESDRAYCESLYHVYAKEHGRALDDVIRDEIGGATGKALALLVTPLPIVYANKLVKAMKGLGTNDEDLIRLIVSQRGRNLETAGLRFLEDEKKSLVAAVEDECGGDYKKLLVAVCRAHNL